MSWHVLTEDMTSAADILRQARRVMKQQVNIDHVTIKVEDADLRAQKGVLRV